MEDFQRKHDTSEEAPLIAYKHSPSKNNIVYTLRMAHNRMSMHNPKVFSIGRKNVYGATVAGNSNENIAQRIVLRDVFLAES